MASLHEMLLTPDYQPKPGVTEDVIALVETELKEKGGLSGTAIKVAYKAVTSFAPGYYQNVVSLMVPMMSRQLESFWADFQASGGYDFGDYLSKRPEEVSESLLKVTDEMAQESSRTALVKAYGAVRGGASKNIQAALPNLGALVQKYA